MTFAPGAGGGRGLGRGGRAVGRARAVDGGAIQGGAPAHARREVAALPCRAGHPSRAGRGGHVHREVRLDDAVELQREIEIRRPEGQVDATDSRAQRRAERDGIRGALHIKCAAARQRRGEGDLSRCAAGRVEAVNHQLHPLQLEAIGLPGSRIVHGGAPDDLDVAPRPPVGSLLSGEGEGQRRDGDQRGVHAAPAHHQIVEPGLAVEPEAILRVRGGGQSGRDEGALQHHRGVGRQVEVGKGRVHVTESDSHAPVHRGEPGLGHLDRQRRAGHGGGQASAAARLRVHGGELGGLDGQRVSPPGAGRGQCAVLEHDRAAGEREAIEGEGGRLLAWLGRAQQIGDVEKPATGPQDAHARIVDREILDPEMAAQQHAGTEAHLEPVELGERWARLAIIQPEPGDSQAATTEIEVEFPHRQLAAGLGLDLPDHGPAGQPGQREPDRGRRDYQGGDDSDEEEDTASGHGLSMPCPRRCGIGSRGGEARLLP